MHTEIVPFTLSINISDLKSQNPYTVLIRVREKRKVERDTRGLDMCIHPPVNK